MLLTYAFSKHDYDAALRLAKFFKYVGPFDQHELLLPSTDDMISVRDQIEELIGPMFSRVHLLTLSPLKEGWPQGPNTMFYQIAMHIFNNMPGDSGWYFFEAGDSVPLHPGWLDELEAEYKRMNRPVMGAFHPTFWNKDGDPVNSFGIHVVGTAIYPRKLPAYVPIFNTINVAPQMAFDCVMQWYLVPHLSHETSLIQHQWSTANYAKGKDGRVIGEKTGRRPVYLDKYIEPVRWDAAVHHGCKDDSLLHIVRGKLTGSGIKPVKVTKDFIKATEFVPPPQQTPELVGGWR